MRIPVGGEQAGVAGPGAVPQSVSAQETERRRREWSAALERALQRDWFKEGSSSAAAPRTELRIGLPGRSPSVHACPAGQAGPPEARPRASRGEPISRESREPALHRDGVADAEPTGVQHRHTSQGQIEPGASTPAGDERAVRAVPPATAGARVAAPAPLLGAEEPEPVSTSVEVAPAERPAGFGGGRAPMLPAALEPTSGAEDAAAPAPWEPRAEDAAAPGPREPRAETRVAYTEGLGPAVAPRERSGPSARPIEGEEVGSPPSESPPNTDGREPIRSHVEWTAEGVRLWLGVDARAELPLEMLVGSLVRELRRLAAARGIRVLGLYCNGREVEVPLSAGGDADWSEAVFSMEGEVP